MDILNPAADAPTCERQGRLCSGRQGDQDSRRQIVDEVGKLPVDSRVSNKVEIVQYEAPRTAVLSQDIDQTGDGLGKGLVRLVRQLFTQLGGAVQPGLFEGADNVLPETSGLIIVLVQR